MMKKAIENFFNGFQRYVFIIRKLTLGSLLLSFETKNSKNVC